ncbi:MAG: secondary thiamine-phosphate synthase enzyme YjbQ [candidate division WOR-3 bacterium]
MTTTFSVTTSRRIELVDITARVCEFVRKAKADSGLCVIYVPHTTAAVTINEHVDPSVAADINSLLTRLVPGGAGYRHTEGNADAHAKATLIGASQTVPVAGGAPLLGPWQGIFFCEFDGPRQRKVVVKVIRDPGSDLSPDDRQS